ncbi:MAG TPA: mitofilin family membrane protein [Rhizomicrobium sp.]
MTDPEPRPFVALPAPEDDGEAVEPRARRSLFPDGALGIFFLLILAAVSGGLIAAYWPWVQGGGDASNDRIATLETRVAQIAAGRAPNVAAAAYGDEQKNLAALKMRLDADEARLSAVEKGSGGDISGAAPLKSDLDQLSARIAHLEQSPGSGGGGNVAPLRKELETRLQTQADATGRLSERLAQLERNAPPSDLVSRLDGFALKTGEDALAERITKLEGHDPTEAMKRASVLLALADLVRASASGQAFAPELNILKGLAPSTPELADLSCYATRPVPTETMLANDLSGRAETILAAERVSQAKSWSDRLWANLANLVSIRRIDKATGDSSESRIARAQADLRNNDLAAATAEMNALKGAAKTVALPWLQGAQARLAVNRDTRSLMSRIIAAMRT